MTIFSNKCTESNEEADALEKHCAIYGLYKSWVYPPSGKGKIERDNDHKIMHKRQNVWRSLLLILVFAGKGEALAAGAK